MRYLIFLLLLTACAKEGGWVKRGASDENWHMDRGGCIAQMESVPFAAPIQKASVFAGCMQGKGWYWEEK